jgi:hypothetical protein
MHNQVKQLCVGLFGTQEAIFQKIIDLETLPKLHLDGAGDSVMAFRSK